MLSVILVNVVMLSVIMLNVVVPHGEVKTFHFIFVKLKKNENTSAYFRCRCFHLVSDVSLQTQCRLGQVNVQCLEPRRVI